MRKKTEKFLNLRCVLIAVTTLAAANAYADMPDPADDAVGTTSPAEFRVNQPMKIKDTDPYENFNRHSYALNKTMDDVVYKPAATMYKTALPKVAQKGVTNFFANLANIPDIANDILQVKFYRAVQSSWRLFFNSTVGIGGLMDVATDMGLPRHRNDFGMTLAVWGYQQSGYFVIPFLGPSTVRDTIGFVVDYGALSVYPYMTNITLRNALLTLDFVQTRADLLDFDKVADRASLDPYIFQRNAYLQHRAYTIENSLGEEEAAKITPNDDSNDPYEAA